MITLTKVTKKFGDKIALNAVSFTAEKGQVVGFLGPNGAGKTTAMRLIVGFLRPDSGTVTVAGHDPQKDRIAVLDKVGYLAENNPLYPEMTVGDYLDFVAKLKNGASLDENIDELGIAEVFKKRIEELSRGFKQRVGLAAAMIGDPEILILDEPTSGLDPLEQEKLRKLIKALGKEKTILLSTHILSEVEEIASSLVIINNGTIVYDGKKLTGRGAVEQIFKKVVL